MGQLHVITVLLDHTQFQVLLHVWNVKQVHIQNKDHQYVTLVVLVIILNMMVLIHVLYVLLVHIQ